MHEHRAGPIVVPSRLAQARAISGLSAAQAAKKLCVPLSLVEEAEEGARSLGLEEAARFAELYGVGLVWLTGEAPERVRSDDPSLQLAANDAQKLNPGDLERILSVVAAMRGRRMRL